MLMRRLVGATFAFITILRCTFSIAGSPNLHGLLAEYARTSWGLTEGVPDGAIYALAQDHEGRLWLGTQVGLYQFDGLRFISSAALGLDRDFEGPIQALCASHDGSLWIGFGDKRGVYHVIDKTVLKFAAGEDVPFLSVYALVEDIDGRLWVGSEAGLYSMDGERWHKWHPDSGLPETPVWGVHVNAAGDLFATTARGVYRHRRTSAAFEKITRVGDSADLRSDLPQENRPPWTPRLPSDEVVRAITTNQSGQLYVSDWRFGFRALYDRRAFSSRDRGRGLQLLADRQGYLWVATLGQGVWRLSTNTRAPVIERITARDGLASDGGFALLEDRDGNIWVGGTPNGLTRLTPTKFFPLVHDDVVTTLGITPTGAVWIGTSDGLLQVLAPDAQRLVEQRYLAGVSIRALHVDSSGTLWVATQRDVLKIVHGRQPVVVRGSDMFQQVDAMTSRPRRGLFIADRHYGLLRWSESHGFETVPLPDSLRRSRVISAYGDSQARIWIAFASGSVAMLDPNDRVTIFDEHNGFDAGTYRIVHEDAKGALWFGGTDGITRYEHNHAVTIRDNERLPLRRVKAIAHDGFGFLWIAVDNGILRINKAELDRAAADAAFWPAYVMYDKSDGLAGLPRLLSDVTSIRTHGGALWFITGEGITIVNPNIHQDDNTPTVRVDGALVDEREVPALPNAQMPAGTRRIQFEYGALNLTSAQKTRYRFRLEGVDADWVNAAGRRQATYMNLAPGSYRFRVIATSSLGAWQQPGTTWEFSIKPHVYQTTWFLVFCGSLVVLGASLAWRLRLRSERNRFSMLLTERARVSREIHDTLLQGLVGLTLQCETLAHDVESAAPDISERLLSVRRQAQRYIKESRQAIWSLRFSSRDHETLIAALRRVADLASESQVKVDVLVTGTPRDLACDTEQQLIRIAREAVTNAVRHSGAQRITVALRYDPTTLVLRVSDDGHGFVDDDTTRTDEHFGIISMRERSTNIGASFRLMTGVGRGTSIEVVVSYKADVQPEQAAV